MYECTVKRRKKAKESLEGRKVSFTFEKQFIFFSHKLGREKWLMDIIIEQFGKKITALFLFLRPNKAFRHYVLFRAAANNNNNNNNSISKECLWCFAKETLPLLFSQSQRLVISYNYCSFPSTNHQTYRVL